MKIIFFGTPKFALPALKVLLKSQHEVCAVYTKPDKPQGRGLKISLSSVKQFALSAHLPILQPETLKETAVQDKLAAFKADVFVNVALGLLVPQEVLVMPRFGCINIHPSLLPRWRGAAPIQRAILAGDKTTGITIMQMDEGLDTGPIFKQANMEISATDTSESLSDKLAELGADLLLSVLQDLEKGQAKAVPQDESQSAYAPKITKEEAIIDWQKSALTIDRMIRAFYPWPIACTQISTQTLRIYKALPLAETCTMPPSTIIRSDKNGIDVATAKGVLRILEMQLPGGKVLTAREILNSKKDLFAVGARFLGYDKR